MNRPDSSDILAASGVCKRGKLYPLTAASLRDKRRELMANRVDEIRLAPTHVPYRCDRRRNDGATFMTARARRLESCRWGRNRETTSRV